MSSKFFMSVVVPLSILLPVIVGLIKFKTLPNSAKIIWYYLLVAGLVSIAALVVGRGMHLNNLPIIHVYTAVEFILFCWFYKEVLSTQKNNKLFMWLSMLFVAFCILNALFFQSIFTYSSYTRSVEALLCIVFALNYFARLATNNDTGKKTVVLPDFYFNSGIFFYMSGSFMLFVFSNFIINSSQHNYAIIWVIYAALVMFMYMLCAAGFMLCKK